VPSSTTHASSRPWLIVTPSTYSGLLEQDLHAFKLTFLQAATANKWNTDTQAALIINYLKDAALSEYLNFPDHVKSNISLVFEELRNSFLPNQPTLSTLQFRECKMIVGEDISSFRRRLLKAFQQAYEKVTDPALRDQLLFEQWCVGIRPTELRKRVLSERPKTFEDIVEKTKFHANLDRLALHSVSDETFEELNPVSSASPEPFFRQVHAIESASKTGTSLEFRELVTRVAGLQDRVDKLEGLDAKVDKLASRSDSVVSLLETQQQLIQGLSNQLSALSGNSPASAKGESTKSSVSCYRCGLPHFANKCRTPTESLRCTKCQTSGLHNTSVCHLQQRRTQSRGHLNW
jgi:hypothetical protein